MTDRVPNTDDFTLLDVIAMSGFTAAADLNACFVIAAGLPEINYDPLYAGDKTTLMSFRNYHLTPPPAPPTVTTDAITAIASTTANGGGNVTSSGTSAVTVRGICWNTGGNPTTANSKTTNGSGIGVFTSSLMTLLPSTLYYVRAYATNSVGTSYGNQVSFTTSAPPVGLPVVYTLNASIITRISANGNGNVTSDGGSGILNRGICWSTGATPTTGNSYVLVAGSTGFYLGAMTPLLPATLYHFRAFATNINGIAYGSDVTFTTLPPSPYAYNWYLPSKEEFRTAYIKVWAVGLGTPLKTGGYDSLYWTSSDNKTQYYDGNWHDTWVGAWGEWNAFNGGLNVYDKWSFTGHVRAVADFISTDVYAVKAKIPGGAYVYQVDNLGGGNYHYWIAAPTDADTVRVAWTSYHISPYGPIPTDLAIGKGEANTAAIIAQHGPSGTSAAKIAIGYSLP